MIFIKKNHERLKMSKKKKSTHLFLTRGVPGTHDVNFINKTIKGLNKKNLKQY